MHPLYTNNRKETCLIIRKLYLRLKLQDKENLTPDCFMQIVWALLKA